MYQSQEINELMGALAKAQGKMSPAFTKSVNPCFKKKYADLISVWNACKECLSENGLAVTQIVQENENGMMLLKTILGHSSGQWISSTMPIRYRSEGRKNELQDLGSCLTYLRRYALAAIVGVAPDEDDDANSLTNNDDNNNGNSVPAYKTNHQATQNVNLKSEASSLNEAQIKEYYDLLAKCHPAFKNKVIDYVKQCNIQDMKTMPKHIYDVIKNNIILHLESPAAQEVEECASVN